MSFDVVPQKLVYGGEALGYAQGRPVLVPRVLPGERVEVEPVRMAKGVVHARPLRVLEAVRERVDPPCPYFGSCGGCHLQHLGAENQAAARREILRETLRRIGKITWDADIPIHTASPLNYRNQAQLKVAHGAGGQVALGFFEAESHRLFPVDVCLLLSPRLNSILAELRLPEWSRFLAGVREIELLADDKDEKVALTVRGDLSREQAQTLSRRCLEKLPGAVCVALERGRGWQVFGEKALVYRVGEFAYQVSPGAFFQTSRFLLPDLFAAVTADARGSLALDLFAGVGLFTLPLARGFAEVIDVEADGRSAADLSGNARAHALQNIRPVSETVFDFLRRFAQAEPDLVVLDPPRAGVGAGTLKFLVALRARQIHYVSCSPPTLARDLAYLLSQGYQLNSIELFDFFPQTYHIECLATLSRSSLPGSSSTL